MDDDDQQTLTSFDDRPEMQPRKDQAKQQQTSSFPFSGFLQKVSNLLLPSSVAVAAAPNDKLGASIISPDLDDDDDSEPEKAPDISRETSSSVMAKYGSIGNQIMISASSTQSSRPQTPPDAASSGPSLHSTTAVVQKKKRKNSLGLVVSGFGGDEDLLRQLKVTAAELDDDTNVIDMKRDVGKQPQAILSEPHRSSMTISQMTVPSLQAIVKRFGGGGGSSLKDGQEPNVRKDHWVRDEISSECYQCRQSFTTFKRKHHCRICGHVFCNKCAAVILPGVIVGTLVDIRVCDYCARIVYSYHDVPQHAAQDDVYASELTIGSLNSGNRSRSGSVQSALAAATLQQQQLTSFNSLDNIRKLFNFPSKLLGINNTDAGDGGFAGQNPVTENMAAQLPFRTHESMDEQQATPVLQFNIPPESSPLVDFFSNGNASNNHVNNVNKSSSFGKTPTTKPNESLMEAANIGKQELRRQTSRTKYSAKVLRNKLSIAHSLDEMASASPLLTPIAEQSRFSKDDSHLYETSSISSAHSSREFGFLPIDLDTMKFMNMLLKRLLKDNGLNVETWHAVIAHMAIQACQYLKPDVKHGDSLDIATYVKIKKLTCSATVSESQFVSGIVITKNVMHKAMLRIVEKPKIMLLAFPLEYYRTDDQYMSLAPALSQEKEHLRNLVNRIASLKPDIVFVETFVSGVALNFLLAKNIIVVSNVKSEVMETISRGTGAEIVASMDRITLNANAQLGICDRFYVKTITAVKRGAHKTLMFLDGCLPERICTLLLKGDDLQQLQKAKIVCGKIISILYNLKMEAFVYRDMYTRQQPGWNDNEENVDCHDGLCLFKLPYANRNIASSPMISYTPPYLLDSMCKYQQSLKLELEKCTNEESKSRTESISVKSKLNALETSFLNMTHLLMSGEIRYNEFIASLDLDPVVRRGLAYVVEHALEDLNPFNSQNLMVLYSNVNVLTSLTCHHPNAYNVDFYCSTDMTLGQYLEELCFDSSYVCPAETCQKPMMLHFRSYAHRDARINVLIEEFPCPVSGLEETILTWGLCKICNYVSPVIPLSDSTWNYSFGKFLEMNFYHSHLFSKYESCTHRLNREHVRYFGLKNLAVRFEYDAIKLFELAVPALQVQHSENVLSALLKKDAEILKHAVIQYFESLRERIDNLDVEELPVSKADDVRKQLKSLSLRASSEQATFIVKSPEAVNFRELNQVRLMLYELCCEWDYLISDLIREQLVPEKAEKRNTLSASLGMRKIFPERESAKRILEEVADASMKSVEDESSIPTETPAENPPEDGDTDSAVSLTERVDMRKRTGTTVSKDSDVHSLSHVIEIRTLERVKEAISQETIEKSQSSEFVDQSPTKSLSKADATPTTSAESEPVQRNSLIKTIRDFTRWTFSGGGSVPSIIGGDASLLFEFAGMKPLQYPFSPAEHFIKDSEIIVREEEPTSIVAFALSSKHYRDEISRMRGVIDIDDNHEPQKSDDLPADLETKEEYHRPNADTSSNMSKTLPSIADRKSIERILRSGTGTHIRYEFPADSTKCSCSVYFAEQFDAIRRFTGVEESFVQSLSRCMNWANKGGQSGSAFFKTQDDRFFMKQLSKLEMEAFLRFAPAYFEYISQAFFHDLPTVLVKLFGVYRIGYKSADTGKSRKIDVVVMENLFYNRKPLRIFDLKGSMRNRLVQSTGQQSEVLLDENLMQIMGENPLFIRDYSKKLLKACVWNDTLFLSKLNVMDYSMLVAIDETTRELVIGIVDFIRTFTWDKKLESWVKESGFLGGGGREPTIVSPKQYKTRFRESMDRYFLMVPDKFTDTSLTN